MFFRVPRQITVVLALALGAVVLPAGLGAAPTQAGVTTQATTTNGAYVALGDSYSSGVGTGSYALSSACKRSTYAFPSLFATARSASAFSFLACTGATTTDVRSTQVSAMPFADIVTVTAGGNDLGFSSLISRCVTSDCTAAIASAKTSAQITLPGLLTTLYTALGTRLNAGARVVVLGYPKLFPETKTCTTGITLTEERAANDLAATIDTVTATAASARGFDYQSAIAAFTGHDICAGSKAWLNNLNLLNSGESFHPNRAGHSQGYLPLVVAAIP